MEGIFGQQPRELAAAEEPEVEQVGMLRRPSGGIEVDGRRASHGFAGRVWGLAGGDADGCSHRFSGCPCKRCVAALVVGRALS